MYKQLQDRVNIAINTYIPEFVEQFLEDKQVVIDDAQKKGAVAQDLIDLVLTLKYWANPQGNFTMSLNDQEKVNFKELIAIVNDPKKILAQERHFSPEDEVIIADLIRIKLNTLANELISRYQLEEIIKNRTAANEKIVQDWWNAKSLDEQQKIKAQYDGLTPEQKAELRETTQTRYPRYVTVYADPFPYYVMSNYYSDMHYWHYRRTMPDFFDLLLLNALLSHHHGGADCNVGCSGGSGNGDAAHFWLVVAAVTGFIAMISAGIVGGLYGAKKALNSLVNTVLGDKVARSLFRLAGIGGAGYGGYLAGALAGAAMGSVIPGFGTFAGAIVGSIFGAGIGAGLGALLTKYIAKGLSALFYHASFNPTNPEKYELSNRQKGNLAKKGYDLAVVVNMMHTIKREKNKLDNWSSVPFTEEREKKNLLNGILNELKKGRIKGPVKIGHLYYDPLLSRFDAPKKETAKPLNAKNIIVGLAQDENYDDYKFVPYLTDYKSADKEITTAPTTSPQKTQPEYQSTGTNDYQSYRPQ